MRVVIYGRPVLTSGRGRGGSTADGASGWQKFRYITLPLPVSMTLFAVVITSIISKHPCICSDTHQDRGVDREHQHIWLLTLFTMSPSSNTTLRYASALSFVLFVITRSAYRAFSKVSKSAKSRRRIS